MDDLCQCPYCGLDKIFVGVHDDEGNYHGRVGCEYEKSPWSGLSYALHHDGWGECIMCTDGVYGVMGACCLILQRRPYYLYLACQPPM